MTDLGPEGTLLLLSVPAADAEEDAAVDDADLELEDVLFSLLLGLELEVPLLRLDDFFLSSDDEEDFFFLSLSLSLLLFFLSSDDEDFFFLSLSLLLLFFFFSSEESMLELELRRLLFLSSFLSSLSLPPPPLDDLPKRGILNDYY